MNEVGCGYVRSRCIRGSIPVRSVCEPRGSGTCLLPVSRRHGRIVFTGRLPETLFRSRGFAHDTEAGKAALEILKAKLKGYDAILGKQKYLAGDVRVHYWIIH